MIKLRLAAALGASRKRGNYWLRNKNQCHSKAPSLTFYWKMIKRRKANKSKSIISEVTRTPNRLSAALVEGMINDI